MSTNVDESRLNPMRADRNDRGWSYPRILSAATALPPHYVDQQTLTAALRELWVRKHHETRRFDQLQQALQVRGRFLSLPLEEYYDLDSFAKSNSKWFSVAGSLAQEAASKALERAGLAAREVDHVFLVTVTGIATPSLDATLINRMQMRPNVKRTPIFGLGCVAGAGGVARASDYVRGFSGQVAILVAVELCSLTLQRDDLSVANMIASGLFGDGAAAVVLGGSASRESQGPQVIATRSVFYPDTENVMGWKIGANGFQIVLSAKVPEIVKRHIASDVDSFLSDNCLDRTRISHWIAHTGGPKVLEAFEAALELPEHALRRSWKSLRNTGNLSSASVLFVLSDLLEEGTARSGDYGLLLAMGPGFCAELVLLRW